MEADEGQIAKQKKLQQDKKAAVSYLKYRVEELETSLAQNFTKGLYTLAAHDGRRLASLLDTLADIDLTT